MELYSVFIVGATRGIGLEFVRQLVNLPKPPKFVFATYRSKDGMETLEKIRDASKNSQVILIKMDLTKKNEMEAARKIIEDIVGDRGLTLLMNNGAVIERQNFPEVTEENLLYHFKTNTIGPVMVMQEFLPLLEKAAALSAPDAKLEVSRAAILNISAGIGSITQVIEYRPDGNVAGFSYTISKTSLNMMGRIIAANVREKGILVVQMCPGWVKTVMGGGECADITVEDSVSCMLTTLPKLNESHHGMFMYRCGKLYKF